MTAWHDDLLRFAVLYRLVEHDDTISALTDGTPYAFIDALLETMYSEGFIKLKKGAWRATKKGKRRLEAELETYDRAAAFEVFAHVDMSAPIPLALRGSGRTVKDSAYDPRFTPTGDTRDLRLTLISWLQRRGDPAAADVDPCHLVFVQMLEDGLLDSDSVWFDLALGEVQREITAIIAEAPSADELGDTVLAEIAEAGRFETLRRQGEECGACGAPLGVAQWRADRTDHELASCPGCGALFGPPPPTEYACPRCGGTITERDVRCRGCGAEVDFNLPEGTVEGTW